MPYDFTEILILILLGVLFFKDEMKRFVSGKLGLKGHGGVEVKMDRLLQHYNHDTTGLLMEIRDDLREQGKRTVTILTKVDEIIRYGVPDRK